jgi:hypothetical protein
MLGLRELPSSGSSATRPEIPMNNAATVLFTNVRVFDGISTSPYASRAPKHWLRPHGMEAN